MKANSYMLFFGMTSPFFHHEFSEKPDGYTPERLTWQWKTNHLKMYLLLKMVVFCWHVRFQGGNGQSPRDFFPNTNSKPQTSKTLCACVCSAGDESRSLLCEMPRKSGHFRNLPHRIHGTGIFPYIWLIFMVNVGKYTIHGSYGDGWGSFFPRIREKLIHAEYKWKDTRNLLLQNSW